MLTFVCERHWLDGKYGMLLRRLFLINLGRHSLGTMTFKNVYILRTNNIFFKNIAGLFQHLFYPFS
jgi:hypothetical protein